MITIYSNPNCTQCEQTKRYLAMRDVTFEEKMLQDSPEIMGLIEEKGYKTAPVVVTDTDSWSGFKLDKLKRLVK